MKKKYLFYLMVCISLFCLWGCSQESDLDDRITIGTEHDGVYIGQLERDLNSSSDSFKRKVYLKKDMDEHVNLTISYFPFSSDLNADLKLINVLATIVEYGGTVTLSTQQNITTDFGAELAVELQGSIVDGLLSFTGTISSLDAVDLYGMSFSFSGPMSNDLNSGCSILDFRIDSEYFIPNSTHIFEQQGNILLATTKEGSLADLTNLVPNISVSSGATISPAADKPQDFTVPVVYTVTSEDGIYQKTYTVNILERPGIFSFDSWKIANPNTIYEATKYLIPVGQYGFEWESSNALYAPFMHLLKKQNDLVVSTQPVSRYGVVSSSDSYQGGSAALIETIDMNPPKDNTYGIPKIAGGTLYTGSFQTNLNNFDKQMHYGYPIFYEPISLSGYYKYEKGQEFYQCIDLSKPDETAYLKGVNDEMRISVFLYEVQDPLNDEEMLTLSEVLANSSRIIARGDLVSSDDQSSYARFDVPLVYAEGKAFDYALNYRIGFFFWSSSQGYLYSGAPGSKLWIDAVQIVTQ